MRRRFRLLIAFAHVLAIGSGACTFDPRSVSDPGTGGAAGTLAGTGGRIADLFPTGGAGSATDAGAAGNVGTSTLDANCGARQKTAAKLPAEILIVLDASGSMNDDIMNASCQGGCGASSKWAQLSPALNQVVMQTDADVHWGLKFFASDDACGVNANAEVPVGANNAAAIAAAIAGRTSGNGGVANGSRTPTRAALDQATTYLMGVATPNPKYIVLATDGVANCPMPGNSGNDDTAGAVAAAGRAFAAQIPAFVIGMATAGVVTNGVDANVALSMMANAGGRPRAGDPSYYPVSSAAELTSTVTTLLGITNSCTFQIGPTPTSDGTTSLGFIDVYVDGAKLERDMTHTNGWDYTDASMGTIQLYGATCDGVTAGIIRNVAVTFRCRLI
jgi:hypothetical protein